jgi:hypothetical protein
MRHTMWVSIAALMVAFLVGRTAHAAGPLLSNAGFDDHGAASGDVSPWFAFNSALLSQSVPAHSASNTLRAYGPYDRGASGVFQGDFPASPGQMWQASAWARIDSSDPMNPANLAEVHLTFLPTNFGPGIFVSPPITTSTLPMDTWQKFSAVGVAPPNTTGVRIELLHVQLSPSASNGSIFFDDASLEIVPEPMSVALASFGIFGSLAVKRPRTISCRSV